MISTKISFTNTLMEMCYHPPNTDVDEVTNALKMANTRLISGAYMSGGMGDGDRDKAQRNYDKKVNKADMGEKNKYCQKHFGCNYSECSAKQKAQCDRECSKGEAVKKRDITAEIIMKYQQEKSNFGLAQFAMVRFCKI